MERFPETAQTQPELVAHHYTAAGQSDRAVIYWQRAGQRASHRAAYVEATNHLRKGLELLETLPVSSERMKLELELQSSLGPVLMATRGYAAPELEIAYARARELSQQFGETPQLYPILWGLWAFYLVRADLTTARELAEQLLRVAESAADSALLVEAHYAIADTLFWLGELSDARTHFEQAISGYDLHEHRSLALRYGEDPKVTSLSYLSWTLWNLGYADQARRVSQEAVALATQLSHPPSMAFAFFLAARLHVLLRNPSGVKSWTDKLVAIGENFAFWAALGTMWQGWILAEQGKGQDGISLMRQGLIAYKATGARLPLAAWSAMIAEACSFAERAEEGLQLSEEALEYARDTGEVSYEAEAYRLKGEFLLAIDPKNHSEVEACFQQALSITRRQNAKALQLRAAMSLGRLWQQQGRHEDARAILAEIHSWFTEGFDTADLRALDTALEHP